MEAPVTANADGGLRARARGHLGSELTRSGYALLLSSLVTSGLGLAYWFGAARLYHASELGQGAGLVSAMLLVASLSTAGLKRGLIRFIRTAGPDGPRLIRHVYAAGVGLALLGGAIFLSNIGGWSDRLESLHEGPLGPAILLVAVAVWAIFVLQDAALIGGRRATVVPLSNAAFSVAKILVLGLALLLPVEQEWGVLLSWVVPGALVAVAVNWWALRGGLRFERARSSTDPPTLATVVRFTSADYVGSVFWQGAVYLTPLLVLGLVGPTSNAHFYLAFQIAYAVFLISSNITDALVADAADQVDLAAKVRRVSLQIAVMLLPAVAILVVAAPEIMAVFGPGYGEAVSVLRLLALAGLANAATTVLVGVAQVRKRMAGVVVLHIVMAVLTIGLAALLIPAHGIEGAAEGWLIAQVVALAIGVAYTASVELGGRHALRHVAVAAVSAGRGRTSAWTTRRRLPRLLAGLPVGALPDGPVGLLAHQHDLAVVTAGSGSTAVVVRLASGPVGRAAVTAHAESLERVEADDRLAVVRSVIPHLLDRHRDDNWLVESLRPGIPVATVAGTASRDRAVGSALSLLDQLHEATTEHIFVGDDDLASWVHGPVAAVAPMLRSPRAVEGLAAVHQQLIADLDDRTVTVACCHGDASVDNVLVDEHGEVTGLIDWESAHRHLPETDTFLHLLSRRTGWSGGELGEVIVDVLRRGWRGDEAAALRTHASWNGHLRPTSLLLLTWLDHVAANLTKTERYQDNSWWLRHNVEQVLVALADDAGLPTDADEPAVVQAAADADATPSPGRGWLDRLVWRVAPQRLALGCASATILAGVAAWLGAPLAVRIPLVLVALLVAPALMAGRHLGALAPPGRLVLGAGLAVSAEVLLAEVLLYAGLWEPGLLLVLVGSLTVVMAVLAPGEVDRRAALPR